MYKVSHVSLAKPTTLVYNGHRSVRSRCDFYEKRALNQCLIEDIPFKDRMELPLPIFSKKIHRTPLPKVKRHIDKEAISCLDNSWYDFSHTSDGTPDKTIVHYRAKRDIPKDFVAFDVEKFLAERILRDINIDPRIVNGF